MALTDRNAVKKEKKTEKEGKKNVYVVSRDAESDREGQQSHSGCCSMREWPVTPPLICVQSALHTQMNTHTNTHARCHSSCCMKNSHISELLSDMMLRNEILLLLRCFFIMCPCEKVAVSAGQVLLRVHCFSFELESLINEESEGEKQGVREKLMNDRRVMD